MIPNAEPPYFTLFSHSFSIFDFGVISDSQSLTSWQVNAHYFRYVTSGEMNRISVVCFFTIALGFRHDWNGYSVVVLHLSVSEHKISVYSYGAPRTKMQNASVQYVDKANDMVQGKP